MGEPGEGAGDSGGGGVELVAESGAVVLYSSDVPTVSLVGLAVVDSGVGWKSWESAKM